MVWASRGTVPTVSFLEANNLSNYLCFLLPNLGQERKTLDAGDFVKMLSVEHDHDLFQFLCLPPEPPHPAELITLQLPEEQPSQPKSGRKRKSCHDHSPEDFEKRMVHRDVERQRRREMAGLYGSLRSLLPAEFLQRRSISNDMHGAENYINHLKGKVDELMNRRNELQKLIDFSSSSSSCNGSGFSFDHEKTSVTVQSSSTGAQVILKTSLTKGLPLSKALRAVDAEGLAVISCTSTRANGGQIHVIESEMETGRSFDQSKLQKRLRDLVYNL